ncbi:hypothetical protein [Falsiroseomonas sp. CW058]|uniref:hypothetical protein n=1 Tax=Falsiroseomonas sp. CW058 TaxID=3388664 RepID=UPI003D318C37
MPGLELTAEFSEVVAWGLIAGALVYAKLVAVRGMPSGAAVALGTLAALVTKAALLPWT